MVAGSWRAMNVPLGVSAPNVVVQEMTGRIVTEEDGEAFGCGFAEPRWFEAQATPVVPISVLATSNPTTHERLMARAYSRIAPTLGEIPRGKAPQSGDQGHP